MWFFASSFCLSILSLELDFDVDVIQMLPDSFENQTSNVYVIKHACYIYIVIYVLLSYWGNSLPSPLQTSSSSSQSSFSEKKNKKSYFNFSSNAAWFMTCLVARIVVSFLLLQNSKDAPLMWARKRIVFWMICRMSNLNMQS